jgi:2-methylcitrate dehydratase
MNMNATITIPAVNAIAASANRASANPLKPDIRMLFKRNILDSLACAIVALPGTPLAALREQFAESRPRVRAR